MARKSKNIKEKLSILTALDEIEATQLLLQAKRINRQKRRECNIWLKQKKAELKELKYTGKIKRGKRVSGQVVFDLKPDDNSEDEVNMLPDNRPAESSSLPPLSGKKIIHRPKHGTNRRKK